MLERCNVPADFDEHLLERQEIIACAGRAMSAYQNRGWTDEREGLATCRNHAIDVSAAAVVDKGIEPGEETISGMQHVGVGQKYGDVRVCMGGSIAGQSDLMAIRFHTPVLLKCDRW